MKVLMRFFLAFMCVSIACLSSANTLPKVADFAPIQTLVKKLVAHHKRVLLVFDDDNTLLTTPKSYAACTHPPYNKSLKCQYLGGVAWWAWQSGLLKKNPQSPLLVAHTFGGLLSVQAYLFGVTHMQLTDPRLPAELAKMQAQKRVQAIVLTARGATMARVTEAQLQYSGLFFKGSGISVPATQGATLSNPFMPGKLCGISIKHPRSVLYQKGVFYVAGQNKGVMLHCLLNITEHQKAFADIIFMDDQAKNVVDVDRAFVHTPGITLHAYQFANPHEQALVQQFLHGKLAPLLQRNAAQKRNAMKVALHKPIAQPVL
jgi:hypothetical protein